jgi:hypothetical protein
MKGRTALLVGFLVSAGLPPTRATAADAEVIKKAIERGVAVLKQRQTGEGTWANYGPGSTALAALTLLECDVPPTDQAVQRAAQSLRESCVTLTYTYSVALCILFFDRLGEERDVPLIQSLGVRLLGGQNANGGWSYYCPSPSPDEERRLRTLVRQEHKLVARATPPPAGQVRPLPEEIQKEMRLINQQKGDKKEDFNGPGDNSNTQFAILGLWVARRHGVPVGDALTRLDARFRNGQNGDGGWGYHSGGGRGNNESTASMTAAGLLGLAYRHAAANEAVLRTRDTTGAGGPAGKLLPSDPATDPAVKRGLQALATAIEHPPSKQKGKGAVPAFARNFTLRKGFYFLWSVERVAVAYSLDTIGSKDWYAWGSELLLASQAADGSWSGEHSGEVDTCFALLFLRRSNLAKDLTASLKGRMKDPGEAVLKAGGVGGEGLIKKTLGPGIAYKDNPAADPAVKPDSGPPAPDPEGERLAAEAGKLGDELVRAEAGERDQVLGRLKDGKGAVHTLALAAAIAKLDDQERQKARDALAERLARMTAITLRDKLQDSDAEVRRAAAIACALREEKVLLPDLIGLLDDPQPPVARAAHAVLKHLAGVDLGPDAKTWKAWWEDRNKK